MPVSSLDEILARMQALQSELETELDRLLNEKRQMFRYSLEQGRVRFEEGIRALQQRQRIGSLQYLLRARLAHLLTAPVIYSVIFPMLLLDLMVTLYQRICFPVYGIPAVCRSDYIIFDRHYLAYLNWIEKVNCSYCSYANGLIAYVREIAGRTEQYWCPIKHAKRNKDPHSRFDRFLDYGDVEAYRARLKQLRNDWADLAKRDK